MCAGFVKNPFSSVAAAFYVGARLNPKIKNVKSANRLYSTVVVDVVKKVAKLFCQLLTG